MASCNHCALNHLRTAAKKRGNRIVLMPVADGIEAFELARDEQLPTVILPATKKHPNGSKWRQEHFKAWFGALPSHCAC